MDSILSLSTLVAAIISLVFRISLEGYLGVVISVIILKSSIEILKETLNSILGVRADSDLTNKIKEKINSFKEVEGTYDLILHNYGPSQIMGSAHIQIDDQMTAKEIHKLTRMIQQSILEEYGIILTIGIYASNTSDEEFAAIKKDLDTIVENYPDILQLHGFYIDTENKLITFDLIIDFKAEDRNKIREEVLQKIKEKHPNYNYYAVIDNDYSD